jgi:hypothetical protein
MIVCFRFMTGVIMIVFPVIPLVFVMMIINSTMRMIVVVLMAVIVGMIVDVFMTMFHVSVRMLMGMLMLVVVVMLMIVFVFSFHHPSSCTTGCPSISSDSHIECFKCFTAVCQRITRFTRNFGSRSGPKTGKKVTNKMGKRKDRANDIYVFGILF